MKWGDVELVSGGPAWPWNGRWLGFQPTDEASELDLVSARQSSAKWIVLQTALLTLTWVFRSAPTNFTEMFFTVYAVVFTCVHFVLAVGMGIACDQNRSRLAAYGVSINFMNLIVPLLCSGLYLSHGSSVFILIHDSLITVGIVGAMICFFNQISWTGLVLVSSLFLFGHTLRIFLSWGSFSFGASLAEMEESEIVNAGFALLFLIIWFSFSLGCRFKTWRGNLPMNLVKEPVRVVAWESHGLNVIPGESVEQKMSSSCASSSGGNHDLMPFSSSSMVANVEIEAARVGLALQAQTTSSERTLADECFSRVAPSTRQDPETVLHEGKPPPSLMSEVVTDNCADCHAHPMHFEECILHLDRAELSLFDTQEDEDCIGTIASRTSSFHSDSLDRTIFAHDLVSDQNIQTDALQRSVSEGTCALPRLIGSNMHEFEVSAGITAMLRARMLRSPILRIIHDFVARSSSVVASCPSNEIPDPNVYVLKRRIEMVPSGSRFKFVEGTPSFSRVSTPDEMSSHLDIISETPRPLFGRIDDDDFMLTEL